MLYKLVLYLLSLVPLFEARYSYPLLLISGENPIFSLMICFLLNISVIFPLYFFLDKIHPVFYKRIKIYSKIFDKYVKKLRKKVEKYEKINYFVLLWFTYLPIPNSGVYSATLLSWLLNLERKKSFLAISLGCFLWLFTVLIFYVFFKKII